MFIHKHPHYGKVKVSFAIFPSGKHDLVEGFEIKFLEEDFPVIEFRDWTDLEGLTTEEVIELIDDHIDFEQHFN